MKGMMDSVCPKCKARIGWYGKPTDRPACPRCGEKPDAKELEALAADEAMMEDLRAMMTKKAADMTGPQLKRKRERAGLSIGHAARLSAIKREDLEAVEAGTSKLTEAEGNRLDSLYNG